MTFADCGNHWSLGVQSRTLFLSIYALANGERKIATDRKVIEQESSFGNCSWKDLCAIILPASQAFEYVGITDDLTTK